MLRQVHPPPPGGQGSGAPAVRPKGSRSPSLILSAEEASCFRAALRNVARAFGGFPVLAAVVGVPVKTLYGALSRRYVPSGALVLRVARAAGMHAEALLSPVLSEVGRCNACGARIASGGAA